MTQSEQIKEVIDSLGGIATLQQIYDEALPKVKTIWKSNWGTLTPKETIRRIVRNADGIYVVRKGIYTTNVLQSDSTFLYSKLVDKSLLTEGFTIPKKQQALFQALAGGQLVYGDSRRVKFIIDGKEYECEFKNQKFDKGTYSTHPDVMQFRYSKSSAIVKKFRELFPSTFEYVSSEMERKVREGDTSNIKYPKDKREYIQIHSTPLPDVFIIDYLTNDQKHKDFNEVSTMNELDFETSFVPKIDSTASIKEIVRAVRVRQLDRSIGDSLKALYDFRCQMTGEKIGNSQGGLCVEAHHIKPFTKSHNNDTSNIIIVSPTYHRIIHKANPEFDRKTLSFKYPNGVVDKVKIDKHLAK